MKRKNNIDHLIPTRKKVKGSTIRECYDNVVAKEKEGWECIKPITRAFEEIVTAQPSKKGRDYKRVYDGGEYWFAVMENMRFKNRELSGV